jgi:hypothetical protein
MKTFFLFSAFFIAASLPAQVVRQTQPVTKTVIAPAANTIKKDTTPVRAGTKPPSAIGNRPTRIVNAPSLLKDLVLVPNLKWFTRYIATDPDVKPPVWTEDYSSGELKYITNTGQTAQWQSDFVWYGIPADAASARVEISALPFSADGSPGLVETKLIPRAKADSVKFVIAFKENPNAPDAPPTGRPAALPIKRINNYSPYKESLKGLHSLITPGTYYVRLTPLNAKGDAAGKPGNIIKVVPDIIKFPPPPVPTSEDSLQSDYEITSVVYTPMHYPEMKFANCIVVTGYNDQIFINPLGNNWDAQLISSFKQAFPIGTIICPSPPKETSWYEKAFNSITDAATIAVNGASKVYNETKGYLKNKFSEYMCNYDPVVSSNKKLLEQSGMDKQKIDAGCTVATGVAFEMALSYAGMPPSIPNFDEMCKLAKGQVVEMMVQKAVEETGMPCDDWCRQQIAAGLDKMIEESAKKNVQNGGFFNYRSDPRGQYRLPYVEIEITRKRVTQKGGPVVTMLNFTPGVEKTFSLTDINGKPYSVHISSYDLYENIKLPVPYLAHAGDKIKLVAVLTPKFAFVTTSCSEKRITGIAPTQHLCLGWNTLEPAGTDPKNSSGYSMMVDNATINVNPAGKIKPAQGVTTKFVHHQ